MWNFAKEKILRERGELPKEEGDAVREYKAMHEENFLSSRLWEDVRGKKERTAKVSEKNEEERCEKRKREVEKEENKTERVNRRWGVLASVKAFEIFSTGRDLESCGGLSWGDLWEKYEDMTDCKLDTRAHVRDVTDVLVSPSFVVTEFCEGFSCCSDWEDVVPQSFSFSK